MQTVNELPFGDYKVPNFIKEIHVMFYSFKGNLPAPHTLQELREAAERGEYKTFSDVRQPPCRNLRLHAAV